MQSVTSGEEPQDQGMYVWVGTSRDFCTLILKTKAQDPPYFPTGVLSCTWTQTQQNLRLDPGLAS